VICYRQALKSHPDRVPSDSPERAARTKKFQQINDAYYTLSDPTRRRDYDSARSYHGFPSAGEDSDPDTEEIPRTEKPSGGFPWSSFGFGAKDKTEEERFSNEQFGGIFEEMLREEGLAEGKEAKPTGKFWSMVGGLSGGAMGFIVANFPGAIAGAVAGNRLGAVRDARGKSVYSVFQVRECRPLFRFCGLGGRPSLTMSRSYHKEIRRSCSVSWLLKFSRMR